MDASGECGCHWVTVWAGSGDGMDGEFVPCEEHGVAVDLQDIIENGWPDLAVDPWALGR